MSTGSPDYLRTLGESARIWTGGGRHEVHEAWWLALSGELNVNYNLACCQSSSPEVVTEHCLKPILDMGRPGIIMLAGPGLATAQALADAGWVSVGALPLMALTEAPAHRPEIPGVHPLALEELPAAREILTDIFELDRSSAAAVIPDSAIGRSDMALWGLSEGDRLISSVSIAVQNGLAVVWSMGTRPEYQGQGFGRRLLEVALGEHFDRGATGSLLHSSVAGEKLYRHLGYSVLDYLQLWSRPRWVLGFA
jgi:GNAT superfamily N-acetyltransferase